VVLALKKDVLIYWLNTPLFSSLINLEISITISILNKKMLLLFHSTSDRLLNWGESESEEIYITSLIEFKDSTFQFIIWMRLYSFLNKNIKVGAYPMSIWNHITFIEAKSTYKRLFASIIKVLFAITFNMITAKLMITLTFSRN